MRLALSLQNQFVLLRRTPGGHRHACLLQEELAERGWVFEPAEIGYRLDLLVWAAQQFLCAFEAYGLYGLQYRLPGRPAEAHFGVDARTREQARHPPGSKHIQSSAEPGAH